MTAIFHNDWGAVLDNELKEPYYRELRSVLADKYRTRTVYPDMHHIFNALHYTSLADTKIVILGQDPYHGPRQAHGLSFSVQPGVKIPPSLQNIFKELREDIGCPIPGSGDLTAWAKRGVLLLNTVLTVEAGAAASHQGIGWEQFTDRIISVLNERKEPVVFILWGKHAQEKAAFIDKSRHCVIASPHPSPFAAHRGFFGSRPFSRANAFLRSIGREEIQWCLSSSSAVLQGDETDNGQASGIG
ncbi:uracil-DNA glycosylase [Paenibacillus beijingensis]|uniref:Uracil-DNA glycosylase n=1 Tax=Paenibacillus beijingensis TaxID=1126833 RepID=A0A0D5NN14_9BACL|nr:uracil-DNA glycosylase [Paenibacillus beijingensis]AJY76402.1 uracil-DNA glycosylase [Paenibacillus beijingensis]